MSYSDFLEKSCVCPCFSHIIFSTAAPSTKIALRKFILQLLTYIFKSKILPGSEQAIQRQAISWYFIAQSYICPFRSNVSIIFSGLTLQKLHWIADFEIFVVVVWVFLKHDIWILAFHSNPTDNTWEMFINKMLMLLIGAFFSLTSVHVLVYTVLLSCN